MSQWKTLEENAEKFTPVVYLGLDGYLEVADLGWVRPATMKEVLDLSEVLRSKGVDPNILKRDGHNTLYLPVVITDEAPAGVRKQAESHYKLGRFKDAKYKQ